MPIYEYVCADCSERFEIMRSMSKADEPAECTRCHGMHTRRALSVFAASLRGGNGESKSVAGGSGGCASCGSHSCASCSH